MILRQMRYSFRGAFAEIERGKPPLPGPHYRRLTCSRRTSPLFDFTEQRMLKS